MHGLTINNIHLDRVLAPIAIALDACWWYLGGAGMSFPSIRPPTRLPPEPHHAGERKRRGPGRHTRTGPPKYDPPDWQRYLSESRAAQDEYARWIDHLGGARIGKPGFFRRYAAGMDKNWQMYFVSDAAALDCTGFVADALRRFKGVWFDAPPPDLPADICLITRDIDGAYVDMFFRDEWMYRSVFDYAISKGMPARPFSNRFGQSQSTGRT